MQNIYDDNGKSLNTDMFEFLSCRGSEVIVYKYYDLVIKIYKKNYPFSHLNLNNINILKEIPTKRILLPTGAIINDKGEAIGYKMPYIAGEKNLDFEPVSSFFKELEIIKQDLDLLNNNLVILRDINLNNTIYNGNLYLIDPGNYLINELGKITDNINANNLSIEEKKKLLKEWNYNKINTLINSLLLIDKNYIDSTQYLLIIQFLVKMKTKNNIEYNLDCLKIFLNEKLNIKDAIEEFIEKYIKENSKEKNYLRKILKREKERINYEYRRN